MMTIPLFLSSLMMICDLCCGKTISEPLEKCLHLVLEAILYTVERLLCCCWWLRCKMNSPAVEVRIVGQDGKRKTWRARNANPGSLFCTRCSLQNTFYRCNKCEVSLSSHQNQQPAGTEAEQTHREKKEHTERRRE